VIPVILPKDAPHEGSDEDFWLPDEDDDAEWLDAMKRIDLSEPDAGDVHVDGVLKFEPADDEDELIDRDDDGHRPRLHERLLAALRPLRERLRDAMGFHAEHDQEDHGNRDGGGKEGEKGGGRRGRGRWTDLGGGPNRNPEFEQPRRFRINRHAKGRMVERRVSEEAVEYVLKNYGMKIPAAPIPGAPRSEIRLGNFRGRPLAVYVEEDSNPPYVKTVAWRDE